jgi:hypothetical protein
MWRNIFSLYNFKTNSGILDPSFTCKKEEAEDHDASVSKVQEGRGSSLYIQLGKEVVNTIHSQVEGCEPTSQKASPPPVVILSIDMTMSSIPRLTIDQYMSGS